MSAYGGISAAASDIRTDYLRLLVTQLQLQNPLDPMDNQEMASQLAQLSQLEQLENQSRQLQEMGSKFEKVLVNAQRNEAMELLGKTVSFYAMNKSGKLVVDAAGMPIEHFGVVKSADVTDGRVALSVGNVEIVNVTDGQVESPVGDYILGLEAILSVRN
jgi:flagellar basal-body rod modification protein FlgD